MICMNLILVKSKRIHKHLYVIYYHNHNMGERCYVKNINKRHLLLKYNPLMHLRVNQEWINSLVLLKKIKNNLFKFLQPDYLEQQETKPLNIMKNLRNL